MESSSERPGIAAVMRMPDILDAAENKRIEFPPVQRAFVWKAHQIENLWDSLLRGYPIGALVVAKTTGATMNLLDGQQRLTSICLPFYDDEKDKPPFRASLSQLRLFLDLGRGFDRSDARKFCFRVATRSHPWGYDRENNEKKLDAVRIARWINKFAIEDPLSENVLREHYPEDAVCPVPFSLFVKGVRENRGEAAVTDAVLQWLREHGLEEKYQCSNENSVYSIKEIYASVASCYKNFQLPVLEITLPSVESGGDETALAAQRAGDDAQPAFTDDDRDEIETLFLRLNSAGTPISGEELNYSLLKSALSSSKTFNGLTEEIEKACAGIMRPARFISISFRLFQNTRHPEGSAAGDTVQLRIKPAQFKRLLENEKSAYLEWLEKILTEELYERRTLLEYVKTLLLYQHSLCYEQNKDFRLPYSLFISLFESAPELGFILLYRIRKNDDKFLDDEKCHRAMLGSLLLLFWLCKGASRRYVNLLNHVWPYVRLELPQAEFWSYPLLARGEKLMPAIPPNGQCFREIAGIEYHTKSNFYDTVRNCVKTEDEDYTEYYRTLLWEKGLVLYAQRHFLAQWYTPKTLMLDDRSIPFDWDHIVPAQMGRVHNVAQCLKEVFNSIGNLRAWPYELNRSDQDRTPAEKFDFSTLDEVKRSQVEGVFGKKIFGTDDNKKLSSPVQLKHIWEYCVRSSFLHEGWTKCKCETLNVTKDKDGWKEYMRLILSRVADIENEFRNNLMAGLKIRPLKDMRIESMLDRHRWTPSVDGNGIFSARLSEDIYCYFMNKPDLVLQAGIYASEDATKNNAALLQEMAKTVADTVSYQEDKGKHWLFKDFALLRYSAMAYRDVIQTAVMPLFCPLVERFGEDALNEFRKLMDGLNFNPDNS